MSNRSSSERLSGRCRSGRGGSRSFGGRSGRGTHLHRRGGRSSRRGRGSGSGPSGHRRLGRARSFFARRLWRGGRLHDHCSGRRRHHHHRALRSSGSGCSRFCSGRRRLGNHGAHRGLRRDGWRGRRRRYDGRRAARLGNNLSWRRSRSRRSSRDGGRGLRGRLGRGRRWSSRRLCDHTPVARLFLGFLLAGQHGLQHISGLGDMRQINLGSDCGGARPGGAAAKRPRIPIEMRTNLVRLVGFQRTGMGLARAHSELRQNIEHLTAFDFQLAREIVDSNLTHPPLFKSLPPQPSRS